LRSLRSKLGLSPFGGSSKLVLGDARSALATDGPSGLALWELIERPVRAAVARPARGPTL
jgi:hypothetical protein